MAFATNLYFFVPFRRTVLFPVLILDVSQERPCRIVHLSGAGGRAGDAVCVLLQTHLFMFPVLGESYFHWDCTVKHLYSRYSWKELPLYR